MARSEVDTTRPFRSVKEAVAVFGDRILCTSSSSFKANTIPDFPSLKTNANIELDASPKPIPEPAPQTENTSSHNTDTIPKDVASPKTIPVLSSPPFCSSPINKPMYSASSSPPSYTSSVFNEEKEIENESENIVLDYLKRLEIEVAKTKQEIMALKRRESEMEIALASLNVQLNRNLENLAKIEASKEEEITMVMEEKQSKVRSHRWEEETVANAGQYEYLPCLGEALSLRDFGDGFDLGRSKKVQKMKPVVPLVADCFSRKKSLKGTNSYYSDSFYSVLR